jgi:hypothetical protein
MPGLQGAVTLVAPAESRKSTMRLHTTLHGFDQQSCKVYLSLGSFLLY